MSESPEGEGPQQAHDGRPERPPSIAFAEALSVPRNAKVGVLVGVLVSLGAYLWRVLELGGPFAGTRTFPVLGVGGYYLALAFTLATATALLVTTILTIGSAIRLARAGGPPEGEE